MKTIGKSIDVNSLTLAPKHVEQTTSQFNNISFLISLTNLFDSVL